MTGCIFKLSDGRCDKPGRYKSPCIGEACEHQAPTNGDRIRGMSDEELATFFGTLPCCPPGSAEELCFPENTCGADTKMMVKCWANWLKAPEEGEG